MGEEPATARGTSTPRDWRYAHRLVAGDEHVLAEIHADHGSFVLGLATRVIGDRRAAEDVTQDVFIQLWELPHRYDPTRGSMRAFLGTLTYRRSVDHIRREEARRRRELRLSREPVDLRGSDDTAVSAVTAERVRTVVSDLPAAQRRAIELAYFEGHSYRQVAITLGIPEGTAKSRMRLAMQRLHDLLRTEMADVVDVVDVIDLTDGARLVKRSA